MPSGLTGPSSSGTITQTTTNPTQAAQLPFLQSLWGSAQQNAQSNPYQYFPGQTLANFDPNLGAGYNAIASQAGTNASQYPGISGALAGTATGTNPLQIGLAQAASGESGAINRAGDIATGNTLPQGNLQGLGRMLQGVGQLSASTPYPGLLTNLAASGNPMVGQAGRTLGNEASGAYLNSNPYLDGMFNNAANQVSRAYQTTTAPQTDSNYEAAGRYGSGALANARSQNQQDLGQTLNGLASNIYGTNYANERGLQNNAAGTLGNLGLGYQGLQGSLIGKAGDQYSTGLGQDITALGSSGALNTADLNAMLGGVNAQTSGYGTQGQLYGRGLTSQNEATQLYPSIATSGYQPGQMQVQAGQGLTGMSQQQIADQMARFYGNIQAPWTTLQNEANLFGQPTTGSNSQKSPLLGPSPLSSALGIGGGLNSLFGSGGVGSGLFGGAAPMFDAATQASIADAAAGGMGAADVGGGGDLALAALGAPLGTVICTELMRQGRMPKRYYLAAARADAKIPQIVRDGYHVWAIPSVRHLRQCPNSLYSRVLARAFNWRSEDLAARAGIKGARKLWRGRAVTAALAVPCLALGLVYGKRNWRSLYSATAA